MGCGYRFGQIVIFILIAVVTAGILVSLFFPWYVVTTVLNGGCTNTTITTWTETKVECSGCGALNSLCDSTYDWRTNCLSTNDPFTQGTAKCMRQYYAWQSSFGLTIVTDVFYAVSLLLYILHIFGLIRSTWSLGIYIAGLVFTIIVLIIFSVGLPLATQTDGNEASGQAWDAKCGGGPCDKFLGQRDITALGISLGNQRWGPGLGWMINVGTGCFSLIVLVLFAIFGRGGDNWVRAGREARA